MSPLTLCPLTLGWIQYLEKDPRFFEKIQEIYVAAAGRAVEEDPEVQNQIVKIMEAKTLYLAF